MSVISLDDNAFGRLLKHWRSRRHVSQLDLSMASGVSQRHISFLESGRSRPSRSMILQLAAVLDMPLRQQNQLLTTAGFAPIYSEFDLDAPEVGVIRRALDCMLRQHEPYPAFVLDRYWNQLLVNQGAMRLMGWLAGGEPTAPSKLTQSSGPINMVRLLFEPGGVKPYVSNWDAVAVQLLYRLQRESLAEGPEADSGALLAELLAVPEVAALWQGSPIEERWDLPLLTIDFVRDDVRLSFFSTLTTLGTPQDITLQELRLECMFPADEATEVQWAELLTG
ncbi:helix-turn-helix transcriptional regulator [filamentous cyanobacterium LEGE 11480]|uniref:Helix-turn-helix transcriptional regulator n=1 Tax=Romeriopsis navalis LEGE 11480 TaxID=2777977 RepID=A0A928VM74_9CYAN|nr:helix-turn-helix transcriptional regulator [Romeriopsis navalis]MBE9028942.1 helix-turn-helix transcriptional regulator [Romeriopsis navalis LEGE 11480]